MRFLIDAQLPPALARWIDAQRYPAEHAFDAGLVTASDQAIREYAQRVGAVIVTKDEDFAIRRLLQEGPAVVWVRVGNTRKAELLRRFESEFTVIIAALERGENLVELA